MPLPTPDSAANQEADRLVARRHEAETGLFAAVAEALDLPEAWMRDTPEVTRDLRTHLQTLMSDLPRSANPDLKSDLIETCIDIAQGGHTIARGLESIAGSFLYAKADQLVDMPIGPFGEIDPLKVDASLRMASMPSIKIRSSTALALKFLDLLARRIDANPTLAVNAHRKAASLRLFRAALASGLGGAPLVIDIDGLRRNLAQTGNPGIADHVQALKALYPALEALARQGVIGPIRFISIDPATLASSDWKPWAGHWSWSSDDPMRALMPDMPVRPSPLPAETVLSKLFSKWNIGEEGWKLWRTQGRLEVSAAEPGGVGTTIRFPAATAETALSQNELLLTLERLLRVTGLSMVPPKFWPAALSLDQNDFKAGQLVLASADPSGHWTLDHAAVHRAFRATSGSGSSPVSASTIPVTPS